MTAGKEHEINWARDLDLPKSSYVVFDRGFTDYAWYKELAEDGVFFVTRLKSNAVVTPGKCRRGRNSPGVIEDRQIQLGNLTQTYRLVTYQDELTDIVYQFLTNALELPAKTVADLYKERWQIELFFKWLKQNLKIKSFLGTSKNAVMTQIWIALITLLMIAYYKFMAKLSLSFSQILKLIRLSLFVRKNLKDLFEPAIYVQAAHIGTKLSFNF